MTSATAHSRSAVLAELGTPSDAQRELLAYNENHFGAALAALSELPLEDEPFVSIWEEYAAETLAAGSLLPLGKRLPQLCFPIEAGISKDPAYRAATLRGIVSRTRGTNSPLASPELGRVIIHATPAGRIPGIVAGTRRDFVTLVQAFVHRNEPAAVPDSMGACVVAGYNNVDRIGRLRDSFIAEHAVAEWPQEFERIRAARHLYQDAFLILSSGTYSAVPAASLRLGSDEWLRASVELRIEHEAAHYFTRRVFGSMENRLIDELIADFYAILRVFGRFRAELMMHFFGLEDFPKYRPGGRLENYRGNPPLGDVAFGALFGLVQRAALNLETFACAEIEGPLDDRDGASLLTALCRFTVEDLAGSAGAQQLARAWRGLRYSLSRSASSMTDSGSERRANSFEE